MEYFIPLPSTTPAFTGSTLLLPQPSLGSLPQLAADLVIHTLKLQLVGYLAVRDTVPAVSGLDGVEGQGDEREGISFGVEVYQTALNGDKLTVVLPRAPIIQARKQHYLQEMRRWIVEEAQFGEVLVLSGVDAASRVDEGLRMQTPLRHLTFPTPSGPTPLQTKLTSLGPSYAPSSSATKIPLIPHGGLTRPLLEALTFPSALPTSALLIYAAEGDNQAAAFLLADALSEVLGLEVPDATGAEEGEEGSRQGLGRRQWIAPKSWERGLMGEELGRERGGEMYG